MSLSRTLLGSLVLAALLAGCPGTDEPRSEDEPWPRDEPWPVDVFPVGEPTGPAVRATIGPEGGRLALAGAIAITIPPGAVDAPTEFAIEPITRTAPHGDAPAYRLSPHGHTFAAPVEIAFALPPELTAPDALVAVYQDAHGAWVAVHDAAVDRDARELSVRTTHFSDWTYAEAFRITPAETVVGTGDGVELRVQSCLHEEHGVDGDLVLVALVRTCRDFTLGPLVRRISVNGIEGGNATVGVAARQGSAIAYAAPNEVPASNPVAVSASIDLLGRRSELLVVAHVTVVDGELGPGYAGRASLDGPYGGEAEVTWTPVSEYDGVVSYVASGTVTAHMPGCTLSPASVPISSEDGYLEIDFTYDPPRYYGGGTTYWDATLQCADGAPVPYYAGVTWWNTPPVSASADGSVLEGSADGWTWSFERTSLGPAD